MKVDLVKELTWRGLLQDSMPGTQEALNKESISGYIGFDPTADSLHVGSLVPIFLLMHLQRAGHTPIALIGGATGMVGDPSGKKAERQLLDKETLDKNIKGVRAQLEKFLDFEAKANPAKLLNNYDWFESFNFLDFIRDVGKHISVNYMMAKDSVKSRLETGMSFTEFSYQLIQGYDFYYLNKNHNCKLQMGGSDQWGNIVTGTELIRRKGGAEAYALIAPLVTKADGGKFGKSEEGNVWLDPKRTSPYAFYQFWLNASDVDAEHYIKIFTFLEQPQIEELIAKHTESPHLRLLQKTLAEDLTSRVHSVEALKMAQKASQILFGKSTADDLKSLDQQSFLEVFKGVPSKKIEKTTLNSSVSVIDLFVKHSGFLSSNSEANRALKENSLSVNKTKINAENTFSESNLINGKYLLLQRGKKKYFVVEVG